MFGRWAVLGAVPGAGFDVAGGGVVVGSEVWAWATAVAPPATAAVIAPATKACLSLRVMLHLPSGLERLVREVSATTLRFPSVSTGSRLGIGWERATRGREPQV